MDEKEATPAPAPTLVVAVEPGHPPWQIPTIYADGIANLAPAFGNIKFYLYRSDPETTGKYPYKNQVFAQIIMPAPGMALTAAFIERALRHFAKEGNISLDTINAARVSEGLEPWPKS
jgi:hypothetical protein